MKVNQIIRTLVQLVKDDPAIGEADAVVSINRNRTDDDRVIYGNIDGDSINLHSDGDDRKVFINTNEQASE